MIALEVDIECSALVDELSSAVDSLLANKAVEWDSSFVSASSEGGEESSFVVSGAC